MAQYLLCQLYATNLILCGHLAFATFPRMKLVGIKFCLGLFVTSELVEQGNLLQYQIIALRNELRVLLQEVETLLMRFVQTLIELV